MCYNEPNNIKGGIMATKKPKTSSNKKVEKKTTKSKTAAKTVEKPVSEAPITKQVETKEKTDSSVFYRVFFLRVQCFVQPAQLSFLHCSRYHRDSAVSAMTAPSTV